MTKIYLTCFPLGTGSGRVNGSTLGGDVLGCALCEDGCGLGEHLSSTAEFSRHDMGLTSNWKHDIYAKHCPEGFELIWVDDPENDLRWIEAMKLNGKEQK